MESVSPPFQPIKESEVLKNDLVGRLMPFPEQRNGHKVLRKSQDYIEQVLQGGLDYLVTENGHPADEEPYAIEDYKVQCQNSDRKFVTQTKGCSYANDTLQITRLLLNHASLIPHYRHWRVKNLDRPLLILNLDSHHDEFRHNGPSVNDASWAYFLNQLKHTTVLHLQSKHCDNISPAWRSGARISGAPDDQLIRLAAELAATRTESRARSASMRGAPLGSPWHAAYNDYLDHCRLLIKAQADLVVWVTIDFDYFYLIAKSPRGTTPQEHTAEVETELLKLTSLLLDLKAPLMKVIPVLSPFYLPTALAADDNFQRSTVLRIHQYLGSVGNILSEVQKLG